MSLTLKELRALSDDELVEKYDNTANHTSVGLNYYAEELNRRSNEKTNDVMIKCTKWITAMTFIMMIATIVNVIIMMKE